MKVRANLFPALGGVLLAATALGAVLMFAALNGGGEGRVGPLKVSLAAGFDRRAERLLSGTPTQAQLNASEKLTRRALAQFSYDDTAWARLAYIDSLRPGGLSPRGVQAMATSYELMALDPSLANWRIHFCLEHWSRLTPALRKLVEAEFTALANSDMHRGSLAPHLQGVSDPTGALTALFWRQRLLTIPEEHAAEYSARNK